MFVSLVRSPAAAALQYSRRLAAEVESQPAPLNHVANEHVQLFDLDADASETTNIAAAHPAVVARMRARLEQWRHARPPQGKFWYQVYL
jgi:hypothetical protein